MELVAQLRGSAVLRAVLTVALISVPHVMRAAPRPKSDIAPVGRHCAAPPR
jgi:predicted cobalt transporter CbtA